MPGNAISVDVEESGDISEMPDHIREVLTDFERIHTEITREHMRQHVEAMYSMDGQRAGVHWMSYEESGESAYKKFKSNVVDGPNATELLRWEEGHERLYPSLTEPGHPQHHEVIRGSYYEYGSQLPYAARLAQVGGLNPFDEPYPPRPILWHSEGNLDNLQRKYNRTIPRWLRRKGVPVTPGGRD